MKSPQKSNKIIEVGGLQWLLKKWRNFANSSRTVTTAAAVSPNSASCISFLKRTISSLSSEDNDCNNYNKHSSGNSNVVPKGYLAVYVGEELERFIFPTRYLGHPVFRFLLREAEEEFGFQQTGVLRIPCDVSVFQSVLEMVEGKKKAVKKWGLVVKERCRLSFAG
ncbi:protein SMALL AUXIN UP-REGULATED RNA 10-like [Eucalyptus grandis]|uniref:protein SMALL AUXIN UP-REGULATED RNA 10-like n=1 Tax=Eucalyptus grandis TaxID=71139 RepID=UPI000525C034|nr:protein SMALL AUXIN UP-REGULATED RNA 10-like [Eucalyptus grandis]